MLIIPAGMPMARYYNRPVFRAADVFRPVTKWSALAHNTKELPDLFRRAYQAMRSGKGGPVLLEIPDEVFSAEFDGELNYKPVPFARFAPDPDAVKQAARLLLSAKCPVLWAGQGILYARASEQLAALAELIPAPVVCTNPGKSAIADAHPLSLGASTRIQPAMYTHYMNRADVVMAIGSSLTRTSFGPALPGGKTLVHSTNDPDDINKDIACDLAVIGDGALVIEALIEEIGKQRGKAKDGAAQALKDDIATQKKAWLDGWSHHLDSDETPLNQYRIIRDLMRTVDVDNTIVTHDSGSPRKQVLPFWQTTRAGSYMGWGKSTQLGYGLGINMGAKLAEPDRLCINIMGDAAIGMTGMDIETAARNNIATLTIVFNNGVMAAERHVMETSIEKYNAIDVGGNYAKLAEALNVPSLRVEKPADIVKGIETAVAGTQMGKPFLLEFVVKEGYDFTG